MIHAKTIDDGGMHRWLPVAVFTQHSAERTSYQKKNGRKPKDLKIVRNIQQR